MRGVEGGAALAVDGEDTTKRTMFVNGHGAHSTYGAHIGVIGQHVARLEVAHHDGPFLRNDGAEDAVIDGKGALGKLVFVCDQLADGELFAVGVEPHFCK